MTDLPHVIAGQPESEEHMRVAEAYVREYNLPLTRGRLTAAVVNEAVDWWNAGAPEAKLSDEFLADLANPIRLEPRAIPIRDRGLPT